MTTLEESGPVPTSTDAMSTALDWLFGKPDPNEIPCPECKSYTCTCGEDRSGAQ